MSQDHAAEDELFPQLLDDYFAECDEHLSIVRRCLLTLEAGREDPTGTASVLDELFRSFHTFKGISGMVSLHAAEDLAHATESFLRAARRGSVGVTAEGVEALFASAAMLEEVVVARRADAELPDVAPVVGRLESLAAEGAGGAERAPGPSAETEPATDSQGLRRYRVEFTPSAERAAAGVNVDSIRGRLLALGELVRAAPFVKAEGEIAFEFILATGAAATELAALAADGIEVTPPEPDAVASDAAAAKPSAPARPASTALLAPSNVVRVDLVRLDDLMRVVGELVIDRTRLAERLRRVEASLPPAEWRALQESCAGIERGLRELREGIMRVRMVQVAEVFDRMRFVVRDLSREYRKTVRLELRGQETEIDKYLVERMMDPLLHLVRNAISHGIEPPEEREAAGKPAEGRVTLSAATAGDDVVIEVEDDGRGIDTERVGERARALGIPEPHDLLDVLCTPGFSTREETDRGSGRGVGMDVVRRAVWELGGTLSADTGPGRGTRFSIQLPLTLAIADALIVAVGGERFAVPQGAVLEVIEVDPSAVRSLENNEIVTFRGAALPLVRLSRLFGYEDPPGGALHAFVVGQGTSAVGIAVDRILGLREVVVRPVRDPLLRVPGIAGATELGDGRAVLILDIAALVERRAATHVRGG